MAAMQDWACEACTLRNAAGRTICEVCGTARHQPSPASVPSSARGEMVALGSISQFDVEGGRSACTAIALEAACRFLRDPGVVGAADVDACVRAGISRYAAGISQRAVEHTSVDEVLPMFEAELAMAPPFSSQAAVSTSSFREALQPAVSAAATAVVFTKPPESVLAIVGGGGSSYYLFDSHPRHERGASTASLTRYATLDALAAALGETFPAVAGGGGQDDWMMAQYNSYEATYVRRV